MTFRLKTASNKLEVEDKCIQVISFLLADTFPIAVPVEDILVSSSCTLCRYFGWNCPGLVDTGSSGSALQGRPGLTVHLGRTVHCTALCVH